MAVFGEVRDRAPAIEDVVRNAEVSRGTFYQHFVSLDEALHALATALSDQMTREALPFYDLLKHPWQRFATGFRGFLQRAVADLAWASFVTRSGIQTDKLLARDYMAADQQPGRALGKFDFADLETAVDFMVGASTAGIAALGRGIADAESYNDAGVRMALAALGCTRDTRDRGVKFSREYLAGWTGKALESEGAVPSHRRPSSPVAKPKP